MGDNQFLQGGIVLVALGAILAYLREIPTFIFAKIKERFLIELDFQSGNPMFDWFIIWLNENFSLKDCNRLSVSVFEGSGNKSEEEGGDDKVTLTPAPGTHIFRYRGRIMWAVRDRKDSITIGQKGQSYVILENFALRILSRDKKFVEELIQDIIRVGKIVEKKRNYLWYCSEYGNWSRVEYRTRTPMDSVILKRDVAESLIEDLQKFYNSEEWYQRTGIPYHRTLLLHGPPGNGKTSIARALTQMFGKKLHYVNLGTAKFDDADFYRAMMDAHQDAVIILEDVDTVFQEQSEQKSDERVTMAGLLNCLDGIMSQHGRVIFMTANDISKFEPKLIRPGRVDVMQLIDLPDKDQVKRVFLKFFPEDLSLSFAFAEQIGAGVSVAEIQGHILKYKDSAGECVENWDSGNA